MKTELPLKLEQMVDNGDLKLIKNFQPSLFSIQEMYEATKSYDYDNSYRDFGVIPNNFIHKYFGVEPTEQYYYRR